MAHKWVFPVVQHPVPLLPVPLQGMNADNGGEFIHINLMNGCATHHIAFARIRPCRKNDNTYVEQKYKSMKLKEKTRNGSQVHQCHYIPKTPHQRVLDSAQLTKEKRAALRRQRLSRPVAGLNRRRWQAEKGYPDTRRREKIRLRATGKHDFQLRGCRDGVSPGQVYL